MDKVRELLRVHAARLRSLRGRSEPVPGEVAASSLEEEFEQ